MSAARCFATAASRATCSTGSGPVDAYVTDTFGRAESGRTNTLRQLGRVTAMAFFDVVEVGDSVCVALGRDRDGGQ